MSRLPWFTKLTVTRQFNSRFSDESAAIITVHAPHAFGKIKSCQVRASDTNKFMADIIEGLLDEIDRRDTEIAKLKGESNNA